MGQTRPRKSAWSIAGFVVSILSLFTLVGIEKAIAGIVFCLIGLREIKNDPDLGGKQLGYWGIGISLFMIVLMGVLIIIFPQEFARLVGAGRR